MDQNKLSLDFRKNENPLNELPEMEPDINNNARILIINSPGSSPQAIYEQLSLFGFSMEGVSNESEALRLVDEYGFDMVILDIELTTPSAFEICRNLRKKYNLFELPILVISASKQFEDIAAAFNSGANDYISKPFNNQEMLKRVNSLLSLNQTVKQAITDTQSNTAIKTASIGSSIINHTIKSEIGKISICAENISAYTSESNEGIKMSLEIIKKSIDYLTQMVTKVNRNTRDFTIKEEWIPVISILDTSLSLCNPFFESQNISISKKNIRDIQLFCDPLHLTELFNNIFKNSIEAMENGGQITVAFEFSENWFIIKIHDSGTGIQQEYISNVFDPFFTTKHRSLNFGVGLSYCYNVMKKHSGAIEVSSTESIGTTVSLFFPMGSYRF